MGLAAGSIAYDLVYDWRRDDPTKAAPRGKRAAVVAGVERVLPTTLIITFFLVPSTSTRIFKTFLCDVFEYDGLETRRYLHDDLSLSCETTTYRQTHDTAIFFIAVWPLGVSAAGSKPTPRAAVPAQTPQLSRMAANYLFPS